MGEAHRSGWGSTSDLNGWSVAILRAGGGGDQKGRQVSLELVMPVAASPLGGLHDVGGSAKSS